MSFDLADATTRNEIICSALDIAQRTMEAAKYGYKLPADLVDMVNAHRALLLTVEGGVSA